MIQEKPFTGLDLTGKRFTRIIVLGFAGRRNSEAYWNCRCDCGKEWSVAGSCLKKKNTMSCGCLNRELTIKRTTRHGYARVLNHHPIYRTWNKMTQRCSNPKDGAYPNYGGRGIKVCKRWLTFENFLDDMKPSWKEGLTIERVDSNKGYHKSNCRWATRKEQQRNRRNTRFITFKGQTKALTEWAEIYGINRTKLRWRFVVMKWPIEKALTHSPAKRLK